MNVPAGKCEWCGALIDSAGDAISECAALGMPDECEDCGACICDGSC